MPIYLLASATLALANPLRGRQLFRQVFVFDPPLEVFDGSLSHAATLPSGN